MRLGIGILAVMLLVGCGYRPSAHYAKAVVNDSVSTEVVVSLHDPENSVLIKDALNRAVLERFRSSLTEKETALTHLRLSVDTINFTPLQYNEQGYIITYRTYLSMQVLRTTKEGAKTYHSHGYYDFAIEPNAIISDQARFEAIEQCAQKAINSFIVQVASEGAM